MTLTVNIMKYARGTSQYDNVIFICLIFMSQIVLYFFPSILVPSFYIDLVLTLSLSMDTFSGLRWRFTQFYVCYRTIWPIYVRFNWFDILTIHNITLTNTSRNPLAMINIIPMSWCWRYDKISARKLTPLFVDQNINSSKPGVQKNCLLSIGIVWVYFYQPIPQHLMRCESIIRIFSID